MKGKCIRKIYTDRVDGQIRTVFLYLEDGEVYEILCFEEDVFIRQPEYLPKVCNLTEEITDEISKCPIMEARYVYTTPTHSPCGICIMLNECHRLLAYHEKGNISLIIDKGNQDKDFHIDKQPIEEDDYREKEHIYYGELPVINSSNIKIATIGNTCGVEELFNELDKKLDFPYFGCNWDALQDLLRDLSWLKEKHIMVVHPNLPNLSPKDMNIYMEVWKDAINLSKRYYDCKRIYVVFPER